MLNQCFLIFQEEMLLFKNDRVYIYINNSAGKKEVIVSPKQKYMQRFYNKTKGGCLTM